MEFGVINVMAACSSGALMHSDLQDMRQGKRKMMLDKETGVQYPAEALL